MSRVPESAAAMRLRSYAPVPVVKTEAYRVYPSFGARFDILSPSEPAARAHLDRYFPGVKAKRICRVVDDIASAAAEDAR